LFFALALGLWVLPAWAATQIVTNTNDHGPGSLRDTIAAANPGDAIRFASGVTGTITLTGGELSIFKNLTIHGPGASQLAIDGNHASRVFNIYGGTVVLSGLTIQNGNATTGGGIVYTYGSTLTVINCTVTGNSATNGGGLYDEGGSIVTVINSTITSNSAVDGGGLYNLGRLTLTNSKVSGNSSSDNRGGGGGIYSYGGSTLTVTNSTVSGNSATNGAGGGIYSFNNGTITLTDSTVSGNSAADGGGILTDGMATVTNSTVSNNSATNGRGGGVYNFNGNKLTVINSTVAGNSAPIGGGIADYDFGTITVISSTIAGNSAITSSGGIDSRTGILRIKSTLLAGNSGGNCGLGGAPGSQGYNVSDDDSCSSIFNNTGDLNNVPPGAGLDPNGLQNNGGPTQTIALLPGSPAVDYVPVANCTDLTGNPVVIDQRGIGRPQGAACDSGAFELASSGAILTVTNTGNSGHGSLRKAIATANPGDTILFSITGTITLTGGELLINKNLTITGPGALQLAIDGNHADRVFEIGSGATVTISRLTIKNGNAPFNGAGLLNRGTLTLMNSMVSGNSDGSGIYNNGTLTLMNSTVSGNSSVADAGGLYNDKGGTLTLTDSTVSGNSADNNGGGIFSYGGTLTLTDSTVKDNTASAGGGIFSSGALTLTGSTVKDNTATTDNGGGLYNFGGFTATLRDSTVTGNSADTLGGGGLYNYIGGLTLTNTTVWRNSAGTSGGGLYNVGGSVTLINSTMAGNSAPNGGGFSHDNPFGDYYISLTTKNTLLAGNSGGNCGGNAKRGSQGYNVSDDDSCTATFTAAGDLNNVASGAGLNPQGLQNNGGPTQTIALLPTSPALDHVPVANCTDPQGNPLTTDQRGIGRPQGSACDVGAFELVPTGAIFTVTNTNDNGLGSLRDAIAMAGVGDTVQLSATGTITLTGGKLLLTKNLTITGPGASQLALDGNRADRVFEIGSGTTVTISGLTIKNGNAGSGSGLYNNGTLTLTNSTVLSNLGGGLYNRGTLTLTNSTVSANTGSGIENFNGTLTLTNSTVSANTGDGGIRNTGTLMLTDSTVSGNSAGPGGGIFNYGGTATLTNSTISDNSSTAGDGGGGIYNSANASTGMVGSLTLINSTVARNSAQGFGGGLCNEFGGKATLTNSTVSGNSTVKAYGGGLYNESTLTLINSTVAGNSAPNGGGLFNDDPFNSRFIALTIKNTLLAGNSGGNCGGNARFVSQGYNVSDDNICAAALTGTGDLNGIVPGAGLDPNGLQNNGGPTQTIALLPDSPAVDYVPVANCTDLTGNPVATDQRGITRPQGAACDVGAYELAPQGPTTTPGWGMLPPTRKDTSLRVPAR
jgi:hypothetical protein